MEKISEVQTTIDFNNTYEYYEVLYEKKYKTKPICLDEGAKIKLRQLVRNYGQEKMKALLAEYFRMNNDWFAKKGHSLDVFHKDLNPIQASLSKNDTHRQLAPSRDIRIRIWTWCRNVNCKTQFPLDCWASAVEQEHGKYLCSKCETPTQ